MTKRSGRDRRLSVYFAPQSVERRAYRERREQAAQSSEFEAQQIPAVGSRAGPVGWARSAAIIVLLLAAALLLLF